MKNMIVGILVLAIVAVMVMLFMSGGAYHGPAH